MLDSFAKVRHTALVLFNGIALSEFLRLTMVSKADLAKRAGIAPSYVTELIKGDKKSPSRAVVKAIADALDIAPRALYFEARAEEAA